MAKNKNIKEEVNSAANQRPTGLIADSKSSSSDYGLEIVVRKLSPENQETEAGHIKLERSLFVIDDDSLILRRAVRLVSEQEWKSKRNRVKQPPYLILPFIKKDEYADYIASLQNQDLFLPESTDLRGWFSPVRSQDDLPTCTAHAGIALMEYFQNRISGTNDRKLSWRFLYKVTRDLMKLEEKPVTETVGATIKDTLRAMTLFGVPPKKTDKNWTTGESITEEILENKEPSAFAYSYAQNYQSSYYFRLDTLQEEFEKDRIQGRTKSAPQDVDFVNNLVLTQIRIAIAAGFPAIFEFTNSTILDENLVGEDEAKKSVEEKSKNNDETESNNIIEKVLGQIKVIYTHKEDSQQQSLHGHALVAVGYDDNTKFDNSNDPKNPEKGAFLIRNSWGVKDKNNKDVLWGDNGYGWLPYYYFRQGLAKNWWSLLNAEWIAFGELGLESGISGTILGRRTLCRCNTNGCGRPCRP